VSDSLSLEQLGGEIRQEAVEYRDVPFKLRAGGESHWYVDLRTVVVSRISPHIARHMLELTTEVDYDVVAGIGVGGRNLAIGMMFRSQYLPEPTNLRGIWGNDSTHEPPVDIDVTDRRAEPDRRIDPKNGYGFSPSRVAGDTVLAVDDTFTTGDSIVTLVNMLREARAEVSAAAVVVDRSRGRIVEVATTLGLTIHRLFEFDEASGLLVPALGHFAPAAA
jgi:orotate phosphoribosyltransferase